MDVLGDLVARDRRDRLSDRAALCHEPAGRRVDYRRFCTTAWKTGNLLRNEGVRGGSRVVVEPDPAFAVLATVFGAGLLGAAVAFGPDGVTDGTRALVAPADRLAAYETGPRSRRVAYGDAHHDPGVVHFERDAWSENPTEPPDTVSPDDEFLVAGDQTCTHAEVVAAARETVETYGVGPGDEVVLGESIGTPGVLVAGVVAPLVAGGTMVVPSGELADGVIVGKRRVDVPSVLG